MNNKNEKEIKLIAIYARVSTAAQEIQETIEAQLLQVRTFADNHGYTIVKEYLDEGWSGNILPRPALDELRVDAKKNMWEAILIYDPDRLSRVYYHQELVMDELKKLGIETLFVTVPPVKDINDRMMGGMRGLFAEYERAKISERFRIGKINRINTGNVLMSEAPYGYIYIPNTGKKGGAGYIVGHLEINEKEAAVVQKMFMWVADEGLTLRAVVRRLQELGIPPRKSGRGVWNTSTLSTILRNQTYIGKAYWGASYAVVPKKPLKEQKYKRNEKTSRKTKPESEWMRVNVPHIVEEDLFFRAGKKLRENFALMGRNKKNNYLLAGKIWCACGRRRTGEGPQHGKHLYYRCTNRVYNFPLPRTCAEGGVNARIADEVVWEQLKQIMSTPSLMIAHAKRWVENQKNSTSNKSMIDIENTKNEITKLMDREKRYTNAFGEGVISLDKLKEHLAPLKEKISLLEKSLAQAHKMQEQRPEIALPNEKEIVLFAKEAEGVLNTLLFSSKKAMIGKTIDRVFSTQSELHVHGSINLNEIYVEFFTSNRHRRPA